MEFRTDSPPIGDIMVSALRSSDCLNNIRKVLDSDGLAEQKMNQINDLIDNWLNKRIILEDYFK